VTLLERATDVLWGFVFAAAILLGILLAEGCAMSPTKVATVAGHSLAETSATYRRINGVAVEGCTRAVRPLPTPVCQAWADFSATAVPLLDKAEGAYLAGTNPSGPEWVAFIGELADIGARIFALAFPADGGAP
jgi:hypothetical protein